MSARWLILHGGALGDLVLTLQLALRLPESERGLYVVARTRLGDLSACRSPITWQSSEGLGLHWLFGEHDDPPPERLRALIAHQRVFSALGGTHTIVHHRLDSLAPTTLHSIDPRPRAGVERHITQQWQTQLEGQGLLVPKCVHQRPAARTIGIDEKLRVRGDELLAALGPENAAVVIHPGSGGRRKCWPLPCYFRFAAAMRNSGRSVVWLLGPVERESWSADERAAIRAAGSCLDTPSANDLVAALAAAKAYVGNDAGPAHLAALLGTPTMTIFGPTSVNVWRPLGSRTRVLCGDPAQNKDWGISVEQVLAAVEELAD